MGLVCLLSVINIVLVSMLMCLWSSIFSIVGVWPGTSRPNKTEMAGITPAQVWGTFVVAQSLGYLLFTFSQTQHRGPNKCDGQIYPGPFWPCTSHPMMGQIEYGIMAQRYKGAARNLSQKGRSWYLAKYRRANPKKGRSWYLRSTYGQTPKRKELIFHKRTDRQILEWKELIFNKDTEEQS